MQGVTLQAAPTFFEVDFHHVKVFLLSHAVQSMGAAQNPETADRTVTAIEPPLALNGAMIADIVERTTANQAKKSGK